MPDTLAEILSDPTLRATVHFAMAALVGWGAQALLLRLLRRLAATTPYRIDELLVERCAGPLRLGLPLLAVALVRPAAWPEAPEPLLHALRLSGIFAVAWLLARVTLAAEDTVISQLDLGARDNLGARRVQTQLRVLRRVVGFGIWLVAGGAALLTFDAMRQVGTGLLTSAGIAGIVLGFAAQKTLGLVLAGIQIALTQPIRLDDVVIVEGEWGRIEEITLTYVVVKIWDDRRLVVPIDWFLGNAFENWTRTTADLLGTVTLQVDHRADLEGMRRELHRVVQASEKWDGRVCSLQVTDADDRSVQVRALVSAGDSGSAWDLRCEVREALVRWVAAQDPEALPRLRTELSPHPPGS